MVVAKPLISLSDWDSGMLWDEYLDYVPRSHSMQIKRYASISDDELRPFRSSKVSGRVVLLSAEKCGDGAWAIPHIIRILEIVPGIDYRIFFRDEYPDLMDNMLSDGKRAIPKLALLDDEMQIVGSWGPYPQPIVPYINERVGRMDRSEWYPEVLKYYRRDGRTDLIREMGELLLVPQE